MKEVLHMQRSTFTTLATWISEKQLLTASKADSIEEQLLMFMMTVMQGLSNRGIQEGFSIVMRLLAGNHLLLFINLKKLLIYNK